MPKGENPCHASMLIIKGAFVCFNVDAVEAFY